MTIGRPQGAALIGKPLDMVIPLSLDASEAGGSLCLEAEIVQGETRVPDRSVTVSLEPGPSVNAPRMHVRSTIVMEEPIVTMTVRAGCDMKSIRTYTLLADIEPALAAPPPTSSGAESPSAPPVARPSFSSRSAESSGGASSGSVGPGASSPARRSAAAADTRDADAPPAPRRAPAPAAAPRRPAAVAPPPAPRTVAPPRPAPAPAAPQPRREAVPAGPRLQLDALEPVPVAQPGLKTETQLALPATENLARRAEAAAQWRAINTDPDAAQREAQRLQALEATLATLREQTAQNQRTLLELRSELAEARESRYRNPFVYALVFLLFLALIAMALLWRLARRAAAPAWWGDTPPRDGGGSRRGDGRHDDDLATDPMTARRSANSTSFGAAPFANVQADIEDDDDVQPEPLPARTPDGAPVRPVNTEELFDVQQQSDFFLSLGQHDQAIAVLREHIAANPGTSALAYLDLLRIFHSLGRKSDYAGLAEEFERAFNADVPVFDNFNETGKGLEHYRSTLARIESQWPAPGTLALIEELVFRKPGAHGDEAFDLAAYQELLLLYSVAKEVIDPDSAPPAPVTPHSFVDTFSHDQLHTAPAALLPESPPPAIHNPPVLSPSIYGGIDDGIQQETVLNPELPVATPAADAPRSRPGADVDLAEFDRTAYETMRADIEAPAKPEPEPPIDPNVIDFDLFDPSTEAEIAPRPIIKR